MRNAQGAAQYVWAALVVNDRGGEGAFGSNMVTSVYPAVGTKCFRLTTRVNKEFYSVHRASYRFGT